MTALYIFVCLTLGDIPHDRYPNIFMFTNTKNLNTHIQALLRSGKLLIDKPNRSAIFCKVPGEIGSFLDTGCAVHLWSPSFTEITSEE